MSGIYFGLTIIAVFVVIAWVMLNSSKGKDGTTGLLAIKPDNVNKGSSSGERRRIRDLGPRN
jgi:hypothetical protein